jgi:hypothetical protein
MSKSKVREQDREFTVTSLIADALAVLTKTNGDEIVEIRSQDGTFFFTRDEGSIEALREVVAK